VDGRVIGISLHIPTVFVECECSEKACIVVKFEIFTPNMLNCMQANYELHFGMIKTPNVVVLLHID